MIRARDLAEGLRLAALDRVPLLYALAFLIASIGFLAWAWLSAAWRAHLPVRVTGFALCGIAGMALGEIAPATWIFLP